MSQLKDEVRRHWEADPCGSRLAVSEPGTREFFDEVERARYELEPFIPGFARFGDWQGRTVLEVGVGLGTDFVRFARAGAVLSGVDLTEASVALVRRRLELEGLEARVEVADAEHLPFDDGSFDLVYSWGVLHHTPDTSAALGEVHRVLAPGGEARIMLYARRSWVALGLWARWALLAGHPRRTLADVIAAHMESSGTKAYTRAELERLFAGFSNVRIDQVATPYDRRVAGPLVRLGGNSLGWFLTVSASP
jgi:SAM-dependent methyltransferase